MPSALVTYRVLVGEIQESVKLPGAEKIKNAPSGTSTRGELW